MSSKVRAHIYAIISILVWGTTFVSSKVLLVAGATPFEILVLRFITAYLMLTLLRPKSIPFTTAKAEVPFIIAGVFGVSIYFLCENTALLHTMVSNVGILVATAPFLTALLFWFRFKERPTIYFVLGFLIGLVGVVLVSLNGQTEEFSFSFLGDLLAILAALTWAIYSVAMRDIDNFNNPAVGPAKKYDVITITKRIFFWGLISVIPMAPFFDFSLAWLDLKSPAILGNLGFLAILGSALCYVLWNQALKDLGEVQATIYLYSIPAVTVFASYVILDERLSLGAIVGIVLILVGLVVSNMKQATKAA